MKPEKIKLLYETMQANGFEFLDIQSGNERLRLVAQIDNVHLLSENEPETLSESPDNQQSSSVENQTLIIKSERVGVFNFGKKKVKVGDKVAKGDVLGIIKGISIQDQVICPDQGIVKEIFVDNGTIVEFGKDLFLIEKTS